MRGRSPPLPHTEHGTERPTTDSSRSLASWLTGKASREPSLGRGAARHCCGRRMQPSERGSAHGAAAPRGAGLPPPSHRTAADAQPQARRRSGLTRLILPFKTNQAFYVRNFPTPHLANRGSSPASRARFSYRKPRGSHRHRLRAGGRCGEGRTPQPRAARRSAPPPRRAPGSPGPLSPVRLGRHTALSAARTPLPAAAPLLPRPRSAGEQCQPRPDVSPPHRPGRAATHGREDAAPHGVARTRHGGGEGRAVPGSRARLRSRAPSNRDAEAVFPSLSSVG